jgi:hypothetical protein
MTVLFLAAASSVNALVVVSGGLASVILGPVWWVSIGRLLWTDDAATRPPPPGKAPAVKSGAGTKTRPAPVVGKSGAPPSTPGRSRGARRR